MGCGASASSKPPYVFQMESATGTWVSLKMSNYDAHRGQHRSVPVEGAQGVSEKQDFRPMKGRDATNARRKTTLTITDAAQNALVATVVIEAMFQKDTAGAPALSIDFGSEQLTTRFARGHEAVDVVKLSKTAWYANKLGAYSIDQKGFPSVIKLERNGGVAATLLTFGPEYNEARTMHVFMGDVDLATAAEKKDTDIVAILEEETGTFAFRDSDVGKAALGLLCLSRARLLHFNATK